MSVFLDPAIYFEPAGKTAVDLSCAKNDLVSSLADRGASRVFAVSPSELPIVDNVTTIRSEPWNFPHDGVDLAFFDPRGITDFDYLRDIERILTCIDRILSPDGQAFILMRTGIMEADWDVANPVSFTPDGALPNSPYFFGSLMAGFTVRPLKRIPSVNPKFAVDRVFRLARKKANLLLVIGESQSGKTTLAKDLRERDRDAHISSDYVFAELAKLKRAGKAPRAFADVIEGSGFEDAGKFFRGIEANPKSLEAYLSVVFELLPKNKSLVSVDVDLRNHTAVALAKNYFTSRGFSTWMVTR